MVTLKHLYTVIILYILQSCFNNAALNFELTEDFAFLNEDGKSTSVNHRLGNNVIYFSSAKNDVERFHKLLCGSNALKPNKICLFNCFEGNRRKFKISFKHKDKHARCKNLNSIMKLTSLQDFSNYVPEKDLGKKLLRDFSIIQKKTMNTFLNRKLTIQGNSSYIYNLGHRMAYENKTFLHTPNNILCVILNKNITCNQNREINYHDNYCFDDESLSNLLDILRHCVPKLLLQPNKMCLFMITHKPAFWIKHGSSVLKYLQNNKKHQRLIPTRHSKYIFNNKENAYDEKNSYFSSNQNSTAAENYNMHFNFKTYSENDKYTVIGSSKTSSRFPRDIQYIPDLNNLFRPKQRTRCLHNKGGCLSKIPKGNSEDKTLLDPDYFHKTVKRMVEIENVTEFENETVETVFTDIATEDTVTTENATTVDELTKAIYVHGLFEMSRGDCRDFSETGQYEYEAAQLAIRHINERNIIDGYRLQMYHNDTLCDSGVAVDAFFHSLYRQPVMTTILGTGSSEVTERLARVVSRWNIVQMSYGATSPVLSDRKNFPMFFRTVAPDSSHSAALLAFVLYHKWFTVATFHEQGDKHSLPMTKLNTDLEQVNVTVAFTKGISERDYKDHLQEIKNQDCRIIICSFSSSLFKKIFCEVYHMGMHGADYAWIVLGDTSESWWENFTDTECNDHQLTNAMQGVISVGSLYEVVGNETPVSEQTLPEILHEIEFQFNSRESGYVAQTYDAVWAIALALKEAEEYWKSENSSLTLGDFTYDNLFMARHIAQTVSKLHFMGISGPVSFHNSDRVGITAFHQRQGNNLRLIAIYTPDSSKLEFKCSACSDIEWQGGSPPISSRNIILRIAILDRRVFICVTALAILGVSLALTFLSFNLYYRKIKFIKLSSPNLNNFVIVGCILVYITVILLGMDHGTLLSDNHFRIVCSARAFLLSSGFSLAFGCMFIKTYRVYHIFIRANTGIVKSKLLHDQQLLGMVSVLLLIDCILVILWVTIDPMERKLISLSMQVNKDERNVVYLNLREHCSSAHMAKWLGSLYIYKGFLLVVGCYMAWETRHVKVPALNDSQYIGMSVYNVVITSVIVVALANVIPAERYTLTYVLVSTLIFVSTTTTLCILFVPKIHTILINPDAAAVVATPGVKVECKTRRFAVDEPRESMYRAEVLNRALKRELKELDEEYNRLAVKMGLTPHPVRNATVSDRSQDDESEDGLPPWISEYKDYSSTGSDDVWCTSRPTIASAFSAIHHVALQIPSTSTAHQKENISKVHYKLGHLKDVSGSPLGASLTTIGSPEDVPLMCSKPVRNFLSDRTLNELRTPQTPRETQFNTAAILSHHPLEKQLRSEPKLYCEAMRHGDISLSAYSAKSLNQISHKDSSQSDFSKYTTSATSNWTTAPLHESTSYSTPLEDLGSSSNNGISSIRSGSKSLDNNAISNYISCEEETASMSTQESSDFQSSHRCENPSHSLIPENSTFCELSSGRSYNSAISSSSSSICGITISDFSTDTNDEGQKEFDIPVGKADSSLTEHSITPKIQAISEVHLSSDPYQTELDDHGNRKNEINTYIAGTIPSNPDNSKAEASIYSKNRVVNNRTNGNETLSSSGKDATPSTQSSVSNDGNFNSNANNNLPEQPTAAENMDHLRHQIFRLKRELILSQLDQSDSVDL